jgi:hypothetical protein
MSRKNQSRCLSPLLIKGCRVTIHPHSDGKWWFWQDDGVIEHRVWAGTLGVFWSRTW